MLIIRKLRLIFLNFCRQFQLRVPTRSPDRLRGVRGGVVGHRPAGREAGRAQEAAQRVPEPRQLEEGLQGAQDDEVLQARKRPLLPRYTAGKNEFRKRLKKGTSQMNYHASKHTCSLTYLFKSFIQLFRLYVQIREGPSGVRVVNHPNASRDNYVVVKAKLLSVLAKFIWSNKNCC